VGSKRLTRKQNRTRNCYLKRRIIIYTVQKTTVPQVWHVLDDLVSEYADMTFSTTAQNTIILISITVEFATTVNKIKSLKCLRDASIIITFSADVLSWSVGPNDC
jgi:hypothetical protein